MHHSNQHTISVQYGEAKTQGSYVMSRIWSTQPGSTCAKVLRHVQFSRRHVSWSTPYKPSRNIGHQISCLLACYHPCCAIYTGMTTSPPRSPASFLFQLQTSRSYCWLGIISLLCTGTSMLLLGAFHGYLPWIFWDKWIVYGSQVD